MSALLLILVTSFNYLARRSPRDGLPDTALRAVLDVLAEKLSAVWRRLWDIRAPFLESEMACKGIPEGATWLGEASGVHMCLVQVMVQFDRVQQRYRWESSHRM